MDSLGGFQARSVACATDWAVDRNFGALMKCYTDMGFTDECSRLWAHYTVANTLLCAGSCITKSGEVLLAGDPPACEYTSCVTCAQDKYPLDSVLYELSGYTLVGGSVLDRKPFPCSDYDPLKLDPCVDAVPAPPTVSPAPTGMVMGAPSSAPRPASHLASLLLGLAAAI